MYRCSRVCIVYNKNEFVLWMCTHRKNLDCEYVYSKNYISITQGWRRYSCLWDNSRGEMRRYYFRIHYHSFIHLLKILYYFFIINLFIPTFFLSSFYSFICSFISWFNYWICSRMLYSVMKFLFFHLAIVWLVFWSIDWLIDSMNHCLLNLESM